MNKIYKYGLCFLVICIVFGSIALLNNHFKASSDDSKPSGPLATASTEVGFDVGSQEQPHASSDVVINVIGEENE